MGYFEAFRRLFDRKPEMTVSKYLQIVPTIEVPTSNGTLKLMVEIIYEEGTDKSGFEYQSVTMFCPHGCRFSSYGKSLTDKDLAFVDSATKMGGHLRHDHQDDILEYNVINFYMPQIFSLKAHLHK